MALPGCCYTAKLQHLMSGAGVGDMAKKRGFIEGFFALLRGINTLTGALLSLFFIFFIIAAPAAFFRSDDSSSVSENGVLVFNPAGVVLESRVPQSPWRSLDARPGWNTNWMTLDELVNTVLGATEDARIKVLLLRLENLTELSSSHAQAIGDALQKFKASGKRVIAYGNQYSQSQYLLASYADRVLMHPMGGVFVSGFSLYIPYVAKALGKLGIKVHLFRAGEYKSAANPLTQNFMSPEDKASNKAIIEAFWRAYTKTLITNRGLSLKTLNTLLDRPDWALAEAEGSLAQQAFNAGLVDELLAADQLQAYMEELSGIGENDSLERIDYQDYAKSTYASYNQLPTWENGLVGLIIAEGAVVDQTTGLELNADTVIAADVTAKAIQRAREDPDVKALVVRLNTPGGSAFAAELIRRELELTQEAGKPVVISMAGVAASGGYWIASTADEIWAEPTTITGSIGVFSLIFTVEDTMSKLGITVDGVHKGVLSAVHPARALSRTAAHVAQLNVNHIYKRFTKLVAEGRNLSVGSIKKVAEGRIWTGEQARRLGLVDRIGGLNAALESAAKMADLEQWDLYHLQTVPSWWELFLEGLPIRMFATQLQSANSLLWPLLTAGKQLQYQLLHEPMQVKALCLNCDIQE